jgi:hypothetical protein
MINSTNTTSNISIDNNDYINFIDVLSLYIKTVITIIGLCLLFMCVILFSKIIRNYQLNNKMFHYLLMKSICDFIFFLIYVIDLSFLCPSCQLLKDYYFMQLFDKYVVHFLKQIVEICSVVFEILATADCYISIINKYNFLLTRKTCIISSLLNVFLIFFFYFGKIFVYKIVQTSPGKYENTKADLYHSFYYKSLSYIYAFIRDILCSALLVFFNILIFIQIKDATKRKLMIVKSELSQTTALTAKTKKLKLIFYSASSYILLHLMPIVKTTYGKFHEINLFWYTFDSFEGSFILFSYVLPFFLYIYFNNVFRQNFLNFIKFKCIF